MDYIVRLRHPSTAQQVIIQVLIYFAPSGSTETAQEGKLKATTAPCFIPSFDLSLAHHVNLALLSLHDS
jgi:hypothetical protein